MTNDAKAPHLIETGRARQTGLQRPSRFVTEVPKILFEIWSLDEEEPSFEPEEPEEIDEPKLIN